MSPPLVDAGDLEDRQLLTVTLPLVIAGLVLELVDADLGALGVLEHLARDRDLLQVLRVGGDLRAVDNQGDGQRDLGAWLGLELFDLEHVSDGDLVLLAAGLDDCVRRHRSIHSYVVHLTARYLSVRSRVLGAEPRRARCRRGQPKDNWSRLREMRLQCQITAGHGWSTGRLASYHRSAFVDRWPGGTRRGTAAMPA